MNDKPIQVLGDISRSVIDLVNDVGRARGVAVACEIESEERSAQAVPLGDAIAAAAGIAGILGFMMEVWKRGWKTRERQDEDFHSEMNRYLEVFGAEGYEITSITIRIEGEHRLPEEVTIANIPKKSELKIKRESATRYRVTRVPRRPRSHKQ